MPPSRLVSEPAAVRHRAEATAAAPPAAARRSTAVTAVAPRVRAARLAARQAPAVAEVVRRAPAGAAAVPREQAAAEEMSPALAATGETPGAARVAARRVPGAGPGMRVERVEAAFARPACWQARSRVRPTWRPPSCVRVRVRAAAPAISNGTAATASPRLVIGLAAAAPARGVARAARAGTPAARAAAAETVTAAPPATRRRCPVRPVTPASWAARVPRAAHRMAEPNALLEQPASRPRVFAPGAPAPRYKSGSAAEARRAVTSTGAAHRKATLDNYRARDIVAVWSRRPNGAGERSVGACS